MTVARCARLLRGARFDTCAGCGWRRVQRLLGAARRKRCGGVDLTPSRQRRLSNLHPLPKQSRRRAAPRRDGTRRQAQTAPQHERELPVTDERSEQFRTPREGGEGGREWEWLVGFTPPAPCPQAAWPRILPAAPAPRRKTPAFPGNPDCGGNRAVPPSRRLRR